MYLVGKRACVEPLKNKIEILKIDVIIDITTIRLDCCNKNYYIKNKKKVLTDFFRRCNIILVKNKQTNKSQGDRRYNMMKFKHTIDSEGVRNFCIYNRLYTRGDTVDFDFRELLSTVNELHNCTPQNIINIARDIAEHSDAQKAKIDLSLENIAYYLCGNVMFTTIDIDD